MNPTDYLKQELIDRRQRNPAYSLTAFARDIGLSQPQLSKILSGKRSLTPKRAYQIGKTLKLDETMLFHFIVGTIEH